MRQRPVRIISSACHMCRDGDRRCEVLASTIEAMRLMLSDVDTQVINYLSRCEQYRDYIANISSNVNLPYMTVNRSLNRLIELRIVGVDDCDAIRYRYHHLTSFGIEFTVLIQKDGKHDGN